MRQDLLATHYQVTKELTTVAVGQPSPWIISARPGPMHQESQQAQTHLTW